MNRQRAYVRWSSKEEDELIVRLILKQSFDTIANALERSPNAIRCRVTKLYEEGTISIIRIYPILI